MNLYEVFLPRADSPAHALERAVFVKRGFDWEAFLLTPIWAIRRHLWFAFGLWTVWIAVVAGAAFAFRISSDTTLLLYLIGASAFGLENDLLEQSHLTKSGFALRSLALGASRGDAEVVYFSGLTEDALASPTRPPSDTPGHKNISKAPTVETMDLLGLFPSGEPKI
ncbi:DUF2628 domain-containing protein [Rhodoblastus acidophilus]|uniref:DUF2628 domain-containing protein n=1 Tax=Candidatus Rhodoblastus alkanivorans TaxID=2954117 RepID=A0ABS9Z1E0_9HYPH|nr:DUF2628 domain-containing protein [Candidatus Rhodoblastus alkanivorans]MCI4679453.1 DUF2628 domain-containing protein [Candidatus Rhodoblastus alkanivorans]MCI4681461.1 DUF2628 domain-containing protein [Candidatus Rhodoblastus alkanivorans]MDI4642509.1 DUF2628 domain-containing protein [Rhodoblastus acidophilus]